MKRHLHRLLTVGAAVLGTLAAVDCYADHNVTVTATAIPEYVQHKYGGGKTTPETYVLKAGRIADRDRVSCRVVAEALAPELARREYWPAKDIAHADLGIVVQWGADGEVTQWPLPPQLFLTEATVPGN